MRMSEMLKAKRDDIKSLHSSLTTQIYLKLKQLLVSVSHTSLDTRCKV